METLKILQDKISQKLTWEVLEKVLRKQNNCDNVKLIDIKLGKPAKKGDSYLSTVVRFSVEYSGDVGGTNKTFHLHVISKSLLKNIAQRKTFRNSDFFTNEILFYSQVWPAMDAFQKGLKPKIVFDEIPTYLCGEFDGENDYILLEDLSFQGYQGVDRGDALTFENAKLVLRILAHFHGVGYAFIKMQPDIFKETASKLKDTYFHEDHRAWYAKFQNHLKSITLDAVQQELPESYAKKLADVLSTDVYGKTISELNKTTANDKFWTVTHGDTWMPNFLIRYDESKQPLRSVMIDFQLTRFSSLAHDLHFFIYACTDAELRQERYEDMLKYYCQMFNEFVVQLSPELAKNGIVLSHEALMDELKGNGGLALCMGMEASVMSMLDDDEVSDLDQIEGQEAVPLDSVWIVKPLKTKEKRVKLAQIIKHMIDHNFL